MTPPPPDHEETPKPQPSVEAAPAQPQPTDGGDDVEVVGAAAPRTLITFPVVGIGASAGGLEALEALVSHLTSDRMAFVVVQHQAPSHVSMLTEILGRASKLRVVTVEKGMHLQPGTVYVAPPAGEVTLSGDELVLTRSETGGVRHPIDGFLRSLAANAAEKAIGIILSGTGNDGTLGLKAVKDEGGITFAQEPSTASQPNMPQSAIDAGCADVALSPAEIGEELSRLSAHPYVAPAQPPRLVDRNALATIFMQLRNAYGVDFSQYKPNTVERRIARRMALQKLERVEDYLSFLASDGHELRSLYNDLLIGVTSFFRDAEAFDALKNVVFPPLFQDRPPESPIRVWVAGCSTGEEAYSVAISLLEYLAERASMYRIQIFATDIDEDALERARHAVYATSIDLDVSQERLQRFFVRVEKGFQVSRQVRDLVVFARHNLGKDPPFSRLDLVTCRNVLIYMQGALQRKVLRIFHYALNPEGRLLLGASESVGDAGDLFSLADRKLKLFVRRNVAVPPAFDLSLHARLAHEDEGHGHPADRRPVASVGQIADRKVIEKYGPPGVIVDEKLDALQFRGRTGPYLEPAPGAATLNLLKLAKPELLVAIRTTIHRVMTEGLPATSPPVPMIGELGPRSVTVDVMPLPDEAGHRCLLVLFNEAREHKPLPLAGDGAPEQPPADPRILELERELATTKEYLQSTIEELEAANEELQSSNEELQSSNEELQSTNEELETSKEELQSTNEELATVNDELHNRMAQLSVANDDLLNVLTNVSSAVVIVGTDMRIRRFSAAAERLLTLVPDDVGRPIAYLRNVISARDIEQRAGEAINAIESREQRVRCIDGAWYLMRMVPYRTMDHVIRGLVLEFVKTAPPAPGDAEAVPPGAAPLLTSIPQPIMLVDPALKLVWANRAFFEAFTVSPASLGRPLSEVWGSTSEPAELWAFLDEVASGRATRDVLIEHPFGRSAGKPVRFSGRLVPSEDERSKLTLVLMQDV